MIDFVSDDQETDVSITSLGVQMFTVPSIAENLIEEYDGFFTMATFFLEQLEDHLIATGDATWTIFYIPYSIEYHKADMSIIRTLIFL